VNKTILSLVCVFALVLCTRAGVAIGGPGFATGTSFERQQVGVFHPEYDDSGNPGETFWRVRANLDGGALVATNAPNETYDYAAKGTAPASLFDEEKRASGGNVKFLSLDTSEPLDRCIVSREEVNMPASNVLLKVKNGYDGIYADTLVKFTPSLEAPVIDDSDRIIVWMRGTESEGGDKPRLVVTAGRYAGGFKDVETAEYVLTNDVPAGVWCRLTIRALSDVTGVQRGADKTLYANASGFTIYLDGKPAVADADYSVGSGYREDYLTPEARVLVAERRLFPSLARSGYDKAVTLSGFSFSGQGAVDDVLLTTDRLAHVAAESVFTLKWDSGVRSMTCTVSNAAGIVTRTIDASQTPRFCDFALGTNPVARVTVTGLTLAGGCSNGVWSAENGCMVTEDGFSCLGTGSNPVGAIATSRNIVGVGAIGTEGAYTTFAEAKSRAKTHPVKIELMSDMVISPVKDGEFVDRKGCLSVTNGEDIVLDLMGHVLQGGGQDVTVSQTGGKLRIVDSVGGGAVLAPSNSAIAVQSVTPPLAEGEEVDWTHVLVLAGGRYAGEVKLAGQGYKNPYRGVCVIDGGSYTNFNEGVDFYLEQYVTNATLYFGLNASNYWSTAATGFIWCGAGGADARWTLPENWLGKKIPGSGDLAIFPRRTGDEKVWAVDFGEGALTKSLLVDADIVMAGTNEFSDVDISGLGVFSGSGVVKFTGSLPGNLTASDATGRIRLTADWRGTVRISRVTSPKVLKDIDTWGVRGSKVEFAGVRGYVSDRFNHDLPYELVLTDDADTPAWKNDTGYTGSVVTFPRLSGTGTFDSPRNQKEILQVFQFEDVSDFRGRFKLAGKRVLLGGGDVADEARAGDFTFSNDVLVRSGLGWEGSTAYFGGALGVCGSIGDVLLSYSGAQPAVQPVVVTLHDPITGTPIGNVCALVAADGKVTLVSLNTLRLNGRTVSAESLGQEVKAGSIIEIPAGSAISVDAEGKRVIVNGRVVSSFADYYYVSQSGNSYTVHFDEKEATPELADLELVPSEDKVTLQVRNAKPGLYYGVQTATSVTGAWEGPDEWVQATSDSLALDPSAIGSALFFRVIMTDDPPEGGAR